MGFVTGDGSYFATAVSFPYQNAGMGIEHGVCTSAGVDTGAIAVLLLFCMACSRAGRGQLRVVHFVFSCSAPPLPHPVPSPSHLVSGLSSFGVFLSFSLFLCLSERVLLAVVGICSDSCIRGCGGGIDCRAEPV